MADNYTTTGSTQTIQVQPSGAVIDAEIVRFTTKPHGIHSQAVVPLTAWQAGKSGSYIEPIATAIEAILHDGLASGASFAQDVDAQTGLLVDSMAFTVSYTPKGTEGAFTTTVTIPIGELVAGVDGPAGAELRAAHATLQHTASL